jgi:hypothetical protein
MDGQFEIAEFEGEVNHPQLNGFIKKDFRERAIRKREIKHPVFMR